MTLIGYTTHSLPGQVFNRAELLALLDGPDNPTPFTAALIAPVLDFKETQGDDLSATGLTGTCPREFQLRHNNDYTVEIEQMLNAYQGANLHLTLQAARKSDGAGYAARNFSLDVMKQIEYNGKSFPLQARLDEIVYNFENQTALIRSYKTTKKLPDPKRGAYPLHVRELSIYRLLVSDYANPPHSLPGDTWFKMTPVDVPVGEMIYLAPDGIRRIEVELDPPEKTYRWLQSILPDYLDRVVSFKDAVDRSKWAMDWKCPYCPVFDLCQSTKLSAQTKVVADPYAL